MKQMLRISLFLMACLSVFVVQAQDKTVSGKVTSAEDGTTIPGVSVTIKGTSRGTTTNSEGRFQLAAPSTATLVFSFVGMTNKEVAVGNQTTIDVTLSSDTRNLTEVVVTGYNNINKREFGGAAAIVKADRIANVPLASFDQILQGQAAGVSIIANSGQPGAAATVRIRGIGSINGSNTPLYIVDGVQISAANFATMNPGDFDNITVLKDADATAIYGSRGANGVIVVTTKRGKAGKLQINYDAQYGQSALPTNRLELMSTQEKIDFELYRVGIGSPGSALEGMSDAEINELRKVNTDWTKELFRTGNTHQHQLSFSGGNDKVLYYASGAMLRQDGTLKSTGLERYTGRVNIDANHNGFRVMTGGQIGWSTQNFTSEANTGIATPLNAIRWGNPYQKPYAADGSYEQFLSGQPNPVQELNESSRFNNELKGIANVMLEYQMPFLKGLAVRTNWGIDYENVEGSTFFSRFGRTGTGSGIKGRQGSLARDFSKNTRITGTTSISYTKDFDEHSITAALYQEVVRNRFSSFGWTGYGLTGVLQNEAGVTNNSATFIPDTRGNGIENALLSYFANVKYGFRNRYYVNATVRRDGSSRFGSDYKFANFGSIGASWIVSDEAFLQGASWLSNLKLKASYGSVGNQEGIGSFASRALYSITGRGTYDGGQAAFNSQLENPELRWEQKNTFNVGLDFGLFKNRISGTVDFYNSKTTNLFLNDQLSRTSGFASINRNLGTLQNRGVEVLLNTTNVTAGDFKWTTTINYAFNQNKVTALTPTTPERGVISGILINKIGFPVNSLWLVEYAGVNPQTGAQQFRNLNGEITSTYSPNDAQLFGPTLAPHTGGITNTLSYKGFEVSALLSFVAGGYLFNNDRTNVEIPDYYGDQVSRALLNEWKKPGDITQIPNPLLPYQSNTTHFMEKSDFIRLRNLTVGYSLPKSILDKAKLSSVRIYFQGQNLWTGTKFQGFDPEISGINSSLSTNPNAAAGTFTGSLTGAQYPALRQGTLGLQIGF